MQITPYLDWIDTHGFYVREYWDIPSASMQVDGKLQLFDFQRKLLGPALTLGPDGRFPYNRLLYSTIKKSGKTAVAGSIGAWAAETFPAGTEIYCIANDQESSKGRVFSDIEYHAAKIEGVYITQYRITYPNGTFVQALSQSYKAAAGSRHAITLWDELHAYTTEGSRRMWAEMTPIPTIPHSLQVVVTYAGYENESDLLWERYLIGVGPEEHKEGKAEPHPDFPDLPVYVNRRTLTYWDHDPRMPWQTDEFYEQEQAEMRPADYLRLHENRWVTSHEKFIDVAWWDDAAKFFPQSAELWEDHPYRRWPVFVAVDVAAKHDCSAVVGVTYDAKIGKVVLLFHKIWTPVEDIDLEATVEAYLVQVNRLFKIRKVVYDPSQFHRSMTTLRNKGLILEEFSQSAANMVAASQQLYDLLKGKNLWAYPDSGAQTHIKNAVAKDTGRGFRIVKDSASAGRGTGAKKITRKPVDFAVSLAMASYAAIDSGGADNSAPARIASPFSDVTAWAEALTEQERLMPAPLRSDA